MNLVDSYRQKLSTDRLDNRLEWTSLRLPKNTPYDFGSDGINNSNIHDKLIIRSIRVTVCDEGLATGLSEDLGVSGKAGVRRNRID